MKTALLALIVVLTSADAFGSWGAIAYQRYSSGFTGRYQTKTVTNGFYSWQVAVPVYSKPGYRVRTATGYRSSDAAADAALDACGSGCGYFTFWGGCGSIVFYESPNGSSRYGYISNTNRFNGRTEYQAKQDLEASLRMDVRNSGHRVVATESACSN